MNTLRSPTIKFRVEIECEVGGACHGVSCVQGKIVGPVGCDVWLDRCGGGSVRVETKSRQHQQYIRVL